MRVLFSALFLVMSLSSQAGTPVKVYCFSGLGADERAFGRMQLPAGYEPVFIHWIRPVRTETLQQYALRIGHQVDTAHGPFVFLGLSFGGMIALELAQSAKPRQVILVSSLTNPASAGGVMRFLSRSGLYHILPFGLVTIPNAISNEAFGATDADTKKLLADILHDTSVQFFRWAVGQMGRWRGAPAPQHLYHIHGDADRIIPITAVHPDAVVKGGGHLMLFNKSEEVNRLLAQALGGF